MSRTVANASNIIEYFVMRRIVLNGSDFIVSFLCTCSLVYLSASSICCACLTNSFLSPNSHSFGVFIGPGSDDDAGKEEQASHPQPVDQGIDEDLERCAGCRGGFPIHK